ncbi:MAG: DUF72 domain-containing protein [Chloroflexi bacterium]|nr:DUF72 domain-containing protein [Chloroflexota bacterium]
MGGRILVGSCSWADKTLIDSGWYPPAAAKSPEERLRYYADHFPIVEVDSTYYAIPHARNAELWVERTPDEFTFDVKAYALFTGHGAAVQAFPKDLKEALPGELRQKRNVYMKDLPAETGDEMWRRFNETLLPLDSAGKLGTVLFQYPPWFGPRGENREAILEAKERLGQYRMAVEFRNAAWMAEPRDQERTLRFLTDNSIPYVCVDEPQGFKSSVPPVTAVTHPSVALLRMHGHNNDTWTARSKTAAERFDYLYSEDELREWVPRIQGLAEDAAEVHVLMNNCHRDYSVRNARQIGEMLGVIEHEPQRGPEPGPEPEDASSTQERLL